MTYTFQSFVHTKHNAPNSNWTSIALNLPSTKKDFKKQQVQNSQLISVSMERKDVEHHREC